MQSGVTAEGYFWFARASRTAAIKKMTTKGMVAARIILVIELPNSGFPEESSNTEPTAAIAEIQEPAKNTPLFGVTILKSLFLEPVNMNQAGKPNYL
jgi:hypothetical protein